jgi:hypothetical protein
LTGDLKRWVSAWAYKYNTAHDELLAPIWGVSSLDRRAWVTLIDWKFVRDRRRAHAAKAGIDKERDEALTAVTGSARSCTDDGAALRIVKVLSGVGNALGSSAPAVMDPVRFTVMDVRAVKSVHALGYTDVPESSQSSRAWRPYLEACRDIQLRSSEPLRIIDRALWAANGATRLPAETSKRPRSR